MYVTQGVKASKQANATSKIRVTKRYGGRIWCSTFVLVWLWAGFIRNSTLRVRCSLEIHSCYFEAYFLY